MRVTVTAKGPTLAAVTRATAADFKTANRGAARAVAKVGKAAMSKGAPRFYGRKLSVKAEVDTWPDRAVVEFHGGPLGGLWAIAESGAGPHEIEPRNGKALAFAGLYSASAAHPGAGGRHAWSKAGDRLADAVDKVVVAAFDAAAKGT